MKRFFPLLFSLCLIFMFLLSSCFNRAKVEKGTSFTYWCNSEIALDGTPFAGELERLTGVHLEFIYPGYGSDREQLNLLYLSKNLPDIIEADWTGMNLSTVREYVLPIDDLIDKYSPNLKKYIEDHPEIKKSIRFEDGYYAYPFIRDDKSLNVYGGLCVRTDWLKNMGLSVPETIDEWHEALKTFRDAYNCRLPVAMNMDTQPFMYAYHISNGFYTDGNQVYYGLSRPEYKDYLRTMNSWYEEGLFGKDYPNGVYSSEEQMLIDGGCGATYGTVGKTIGNAIKAGVSVEGAPYPVLKKGERPFSSQYDVIATRYGAAAISTNCDEPEAAARFLDFGYSKEGILLYNFGVQGQSYTIDDGKPVYTDLITGATSVNDIMNRYLRANNSGPFIQTKEYMQQYGAAAEQKRTLERWRDTDAEMHTLPSLHFTQEESAELSQLSYASYASDAELSFIMGITSLDEFDNYLKKLSEAGADRALEIYRAAYARFLSN